ncbi:nitrogen fixation NifU-like protein [Bacilli bacterium PM5-3]|nr:nitrogen fixation NifU-like protein [Bacilli bacterium PM5-3]MDH6603081.1 nitrogen fixation NifU-like protein [Bacilli bacterium PM5-9]
MATINDPMILRQIIMDHYENPRNRELISDDGYYSVRKDSESCIDDITMQVKFNNDIIEDIRFDGEACTISTASTSILTELVIGKTIDEALKIIENYQNMIFEKEYDADILEEAIAFQNVHKQANRIKCATIGFDALSEIIADYKGGNVNE